MGTVMTPGTPRPLSGQYWLCLCVTAAQGCARLSVPGTWPRTHGVPAAAKPGRHNRFCPQLLLDTRVGAEVNHRPHPVPRFPQRLLSPARRQGPRYASVSPAGTAAVVGGLGGRGVRRGRRRQLPRLSVTEVCRSPALPPAASPEGATSSSLQKIPLPQAPLGRGVPTPGLERGPGSAPVTARGWSVALAGRAGASGEPEAG